MSSLVVTAANVALSSGSSSKDFPAAETITAGKSVYLNSANKWALAQATTATLAGSTVGGTLPGRTGIALHGSLLNQPLAVQESGVINLGATLTVGVLYVIAADAAGSIAPITDLVSTNKLNILGLATSAALLDLAYKNAYPGGYSGVAVA